LLRATPAFADVAEKGRRDRRRVGGDVLPLDEAALEGLDAALLRPLPHLAKQLGGERRGGAEGGEVLLLCEELGKHQGRFAAPAGGVPKGNSPTFMGAPSLGGKEPPIAVHTNSGQVPEVGGNALHSAVRHVRGALRVSREAALQREIDGCPRVFGQASE